MRLLSKATLVDAASPHIPIDLIIQKAVNEAKVAGASPENAALIVAALAYFSGAAARAGVPMANRKLGAMARMHAGACKTSGIALVTNKFTHRIPAFPAYKAVYEELLNKKLTKVDGAVLPPFIAGGAIYGHSALGEDINIPELAKNAGLGAVEAANLPEKLHVRGTREEFDTAKVIGDFGLILKDIGGPSVIGSMALNEIFAGFEESPIIGAGFSGGPVNPPLGHLCGDVVPAIRLMLKHNDLYKVAEDIRNYKMNSFIDPEMALCALNTITRKAEEVKRGPITRACMLASKDVRDRAIYRGAVKAYEMIKEGKTVEEVAKALDDEKKAYVEKRGICNSRW